MSAHVLSNLFIKQVSDKMQGLSISGYVKSMIRKWFNHRLQNNPCHSEEETHKTDSHYTSKVKQPASFSSAR